MTEAIFPERRTRSQLTLPDNILQIPPRSPLKDARTTLRNHAANQAEEACSPTNSKSDETDDELLLSPGKQHTPMQKPGPSHSKRSASPPPHDEYTLGSGSVEGRELKRVKRDSDTLEAAEDRPETVKAESLLLKRLTPGHTRNHSEPNVPPTTRRSARKRRPADSTKPVSTVSVSPPPSEFSPKTVFSKVERAQSVPLFPSSQDIPRIDFRNPPPSPKRTRSPSRSPDKNGEFKRRLFAQFNITRTLSTVQDAAEPSTKMDLDDAPTSVCDEVEMEIPQAPVASTEPFEPTNASEPIPITLSTPSDSTPYIPPEVPATPQSRSLNKLIPLSPLTPLPETPLPPRHTANVDSDNRYAGGLGWGLPSSESMPKPIPGPSLIPPAPVVPKSRLPRPPMGPPPVPFSKASKVQPMGPPTLPIASKKPGMSTQPTNTTTKKETKNAFTLLMKKPREEMARMAKEKAQRESKSGTSLQTGTGILAGPSSQPKLKMKDKMRPKTKIKEEKTPQLAPLSDEEEDNPVRDEEHTVSSVETESLTLRPSEHPLPLSPEVVMEAEPSRADRNEIKADDPSALTIVQEVLADEEIVIPMVPVDSTVVSENTPTTADNAETDTLVEPLDEGAEPPAPPSAANDLEESKETEVVNDPLPPKDPAPTKLPIAKKRRPVSVLPASRVTRSVSNSKKKADEILLSTAGPSSKKPNTAPGFTATKRTASGTVRKTTESNNVTQTSLTDKSEEQPPSAPGSPMKVSSPAKSSALITPKKTPKPFSFSLKPTSTPSPSKIARSSSLFSDKSSNFLTARSFSMATSQVSLGAGSSLSTLSNALEKLRMPAPSRPSTSMGFNRDTPSELNSAPTKSQDDAGVGRNSIGLGRPEGLKRASTLDGSAFKAPATATSNAAASSSKSASSSRKNLVQKPLSMFMSNKGTMGRPHFGVGGGPRRTVSKKPPLPMVVGSPVKGGGAAMLEDNDEVEVVQDTEDVGMTSVSNDTSPLLLQDLTTTEGSTKGKGKEKDYGSRRVSMISHALSQSLSAIPPPPARGLMGPPATPPAGRSPTRSTSSSYPSTSAGGSSPSQPGHATGTRSSARLAKTAPALMKIRGGTDGHVTSGRKGASEAATPPDPAAEALKVLKDCVIFVDVKTDDGDEAGSLFSQMLTGIGARLLTRVGQTCTHIVYKNGLTSTLTRYRLLREPKPLVVGIGWVVECVEQRKRVDEKDFLVDLEGTNVAGIIKRRRSILPKSFAMEDGIGAQFETDKEDGDRSMDGSTSSIMGDDDLAPLERARRRKSIMVGPR